MARRSWEPASYPVRTPTDLEQQVGRINNPPRTQRLGGVGERKIYPITKLIGDEGPEPIRPVSDRGKGSGKRG